jgi:hypothetical protein
MAEYTYDPTQGKIVPVSQARVVTYITTDPKGMPASNEAAREATGSSSGAQPQTGSAASYGLSDLQNAARLAAEAAITAASPYNVRSTAGDELLKKEAAVAAQKALDAVTKSTAVAAVPVGALAPVAPTSTPVTGTPLKRSGAAITTVTGKPIKKIKDEPINVDFAGLSAEEKAAIGAIGEGAAVPTAAPVFTQEALDAAVAAAVAAAETKAADAAAKEKEDAEIAAAAAAAAGKGGGLTQTDLDRAIREALAKQTAATEAAAREARAAEDAKKLAVKVKASDRLTSMFAGYGLETLAGFINRRIMADVSEEMLLLELYDQPEYQLRFPGMKALRSKNKTITEKEYIDDEKAFIQTARFFDVPIGFYDSADDFGKLIGNLVSPKEYQERLQIGQDFARAMNPAARNQLQEFYNVGEGAITAFVLDADKALPLIQKQAKAAQFVGFGRDKGFKLEGMTAAQAEQIAGTEAYSKLSSLQMEQALGQAAQLRQTQSRLTGVEGEVYDEQEALKAVIEGSPEALLASQQRAKREGARFGGSGGITGSSLRSAPGI